jgi:hypothetical protein
MKNIILTLLIILSDQVFANEIMLSPVTYGSGTDGQWTPPFNRDVIYPA